MSLEDIKGAIEDIRQGKFVIVVDDEDRENEGDLIMAAEMVTPEAVAFLIRYTSGVVCVPLTPDRLDALRLPLMVQNNTESHSTAFTISVDYAHNTTTGISAEDRSATIKALGDPSAQPTDFRRPGHIFPLRYREGGVLKRAGHTEAAIDMARLAGLGSAGVLCEIVNDDGSMARRPQLEVFAKKHHLRIITIADLIRYRRLNEKLVQCVAEARVPTAFGDFTAFVYKSLVDEMEHIAFVKGNVRNKQNVLVRVHSECLTGDVFQSLRCDCGAQLQKAFNIIAGHDEGIFIYLRGHEGRGIGLAHKLRAYELQDKGHDTVEANEALGLPIDSREYGIGSQILADLGVTTIKLMTNNPAKYGGLEGYDLKIVERIPLHTIPTKENYHYLRTKQKKLGHLLDIQDGHLHKQ